MKWLNRLIRKPKVWATARKKDDLAYLDPFFIESTKVDGLPGPSVIAEIRGPDRQSYKLEVPAGQRILVLSQKTNGRKLSHLPALTRDGNGLAMYIATTYDCTQYKLLGTFDEDLINNVQHILSEREL